MDKSDLKLLLEARNNLRNLCAHYGTSPANQELLTRMDVRIDMAIAEYNSSFARNVVMVGRQFITEADHYMNADSTIAEMLQSVKEFRDILNTHIAGVEALDTLLKENTKK